MAHLHSSSGHLRGLRIHGWGVLLLAGAHLTVGATDTQDLARPAASRWPPRTLELAVQSWDKLARVSSDVSGTRSSAWYPYIPGMPLARRFMLLQLNMLSLVCTGDVLGVPELEMDTTL